MESSNQPWKARRTSLKTNRQTDILLTKPNQCKTQKEQLSFKNEIHLPVIAERRIQIVQSCLVVPCSHDFFRSKRNLRIRWQDFMSTSCQQQHPLGFPNQVNGVWSAVGRLIFPSKLALETKLCSRISRYSLGISTWNFACQFVMTLPLHC